jgi:hypothetical protein
MRNAIISFIYYFSTPSLLNSRHIAQKCWPLGLNSDITERKMYVAISNKADHLRLIKTE